MDGASVGGGIRFTWQPEFAPYGGFSADLSVAKAIDGQAVNTTLAQVVSGQQRGWRAFVIVTGRL